MAMAKSLTRKQQKSLKKITLTVEHIDGRCDDLSMRIHPGTHLGSLMARWMEERKSPEYVMVEFTYEGRTLGHDDTVASVGMSDGDTIFVHDDMFGTWMRQDTIVRTEETV